MRQIAHPFHIDSSGRTADANNDDHIRQMIEQLLFTSPGDRVNRPTFGSGLMQLVFAPNSAEVATATEYLVQGALQQWMNDLIHVETVQVDNADGTLRVTVQYRVLNTQARSVAQFFRQT
jgi:phage baseplate assembly protein W